MFKRVREAVVRETRQLQVPWESSSLLGEFAFVPGVDAQPRSAEADAERPASWRSGTASRARTAPTNTAPTCASTRAAASPTLAQTRIAALAPPRRRPRRRTAGGAT